MNTTVSSAIVGTWALCECISMSPDGKSMRPFGAQPLGQLIYTNSGHMSVSMASPHREGLGIPIEQIGPMAWWRPAKMRATGIYLKSAGQFSAYAGTYKVRGDTIVHNILVGHYTDMIGAEVERQFTLNDDNTLELRYTDSIGARYRLLWRRQA
jgi:hypothetical protein